MPKIVQFRISKISLIPFFTLVSFFVLPLVTCPLMGQVMVKQKLDPASYSLWSKLEMEKTASNEKWVSFTISYANKTDSLFLRRVSDNKTYRFSSASTSLFTKNNFFVYMKNDTLITINPENGKMDFVKDVDHYEYSHPTNLLIVYSRIEKNKGTLKIKIPLGETVQEISNVTNFSLSPLGMHLLYNLYFNSKNSTFLTYLKKLNTSECIINTTENYYDNFTWQRNDKAVAFCGNLTTGEPASVFLYTVADKNLYHFDPYKSDAFPKDNSILGPARNKMLVSDDLQKVFFSISNKNETSSNHLDSKVEIWNTKDRWIYPQQQRDGNLPTSPKISIWMPKANFFRQVTDDKLVSIMLSADCRFAVLSDPKAYEPQFEFESPRDYYFLDLKTFKKHLILLKQPVMMHDISISPGGKYISYTKDTNWWIYNIENRTHTNITSKINQSFFGKVHLLSADSAYGNPGWSSLDKEILLYDEFDLWAVKPDGNGFRRLTNGRELKIKYRMDLKPISINRKYLYDGLLMPKYDLSKTILLRGENQNGQTGFYIWNDTNTINTILASDSYFSNLIAGSKKQTFFCTEQRFDLPPRIISIDNTSTKKCIFQSNPQHKTFNWGKSELIFFKNSKNKSLKGILYYPSDYDPMQKYPMIVSIYETQSQGLHKYWNPSLKNESGYNPTIFTLNGYFVFLPDIIHETENVGPSTLDCVVAGTQSIIDRGIVNSKKIGIMGHSFGGYETSYVINRTDIFAAAIASGAITDLNSRYLTIGVNMAKSEMWRFASGGWRMGEKTPFSNRKDFDKNSPLVFIENLQTPLLMWSGKEDTQVDPFQSTAYYMALRRLNKNNILLLYPKEGHVLLNPINQIDLTERILQWFDNYLKDEKTYNWIYKTN